MPTPLHQDRLVAFMNRNGYRYAANDKGEVTGIWDGAFFSFAAREDGLLQVRGYWQRQASIGRLEPVLEACNTWHTDKVWPKAYVRVGDNGDVMVFGELNVHLSDGVTDDQLDELLHCGISTASELFEFLDGMFPDPLKEAS